MIDTAIWVTGVLTWIVFGVVGILWLSDLLLDWVIKSFWSRKECMAFVWDRLTAKRDAR